MTELAASFHVTAAGSSNSLPAQVFTLRAAPAGEQLRAQVDIVTGLSDNSRPRPGANVAQQIVGWRIQIAGVTISEDDLIGSVEVTRQIDGAATFSFGIPLSSAARLVPELPDLSVLSLGSVFGAHGPPTGLKSIDIFGIVVSDAAVHTVQLVRNGIATQATQGVNGVGVAELRISGLGPRGRFDRRRITYKLPAGHNIPRNKVVRQIVEKIGATMGREWVGRKMLKEVQAVDVPGLELAEAIADADNIALQFDESGDVSGFPQLDDSSQIGWTFGQDDVLEAGAVVASGDNDGPTRVTVTTNAQLLRDEEGCILRTVETISEGFSNYSVKGSVATQAATTGTVTPHADKSVPERFIMTSRVVTRSTFHCSTLVHRLTTTQAWAKVEKRRFRYVANPDGVDGSGNYLDYFGGDFFGSVPVKNDTAPLFDHSRERFRVISEVEETRTFDDRGFLLTERIEERTLYDLRLRLKDRSLASETWEGQSHAVNLDAFGNGDAVDFSRETLRPTKLTIRELSVDDLGFITGEVRTIYNSAAKEGFKHLYNGGRESNDAGEAGGPQTVLGLNVHQTQNIVYSEIAENKILQTTAVHDAEGRAVTVDNVQREGFLPAVPRLDNLTPDPANFEDPEDAELAKAASARESVPLECTVQSGPAPKGLEGLRPIHEVNEAFEWGEDQDDICDRALTILRLGAAVDVSFLLPANFLLKPGRRVHLVVPAAKINHDIHIRAVTWASDAVGPITTNVQGKVYGL